MMKSLFIGTVLALALVVSSAVASDTNSASLFTGHEFSVNASTAYQLKGYAKLNGAYDINAAVGLGYYFNKYIGVEGSLPFYNTEGVAVKDVTLDGLVRLPITVGKQFGFAPYLGLGTDFAWKNVDFSPLAKGGVEFRFTHYLGTFVEYQYVIPSFQEYDKGASQVVGGFKLVF
jgi:hypothetical protein